MTQKNQNSPLSQRRTSPYEKLVQQMHDLYDGNISDAEAHEAARNLIDFCKLLLEFQAEVNQNKKND